MYEFLLYFTEFLLCAFLCWVIIVTQRFHGYYTADSRTGIQNFHEKHVARIGGVAIILTILFFTVFAKIVSEPLIYVLITGIPVFLAGLGEDLFKVVTPYIRLFIAFLSAFLFIITSGYVADSIDTPILRLFFEYRPFAILLTAIALAGLANAINIIDGLHGLASFTLMVEFLSMALLSYWVDDQDIMVFALIHFSAILGFFIWNYPEGKIILGDGGAYYLGFALGAGMIMIFERNQEISPWVTLLIVAYPVAETMVSIYRRIVRRGTSPEKADNIHLHHLVRRSFARPICRRLGLEEKWNNPIASALMWVFPMSSCGLALISFHFSPYLSMFFAIAFFTLYFLLYFKLVKSYFKPRFSKRHRI